MKGLDVAVRYMLRLGPTYKNYTMFEGGNPNVGFWVPLRCERMSDGDHVVQTWNLEDLPEEYKIGNEVTMEDLYDP